MAQYRSRWTGEAIDDAVDKVRKIAYINLNENPQEAYEAAEAAYSAGFDIVARYDRNMGVGTLVQSFELLCVLRQQTKNSSQQTSTYYWFRSFVTHTSLKLAFKLGCDYGSTTATLEDITATYQWEATQETLGIQEQSNDDIAEHDIPEGSYVYFKAGIAKAITNIAVGDTLRAVSPNRNLAWISNGGLNDLKSAITKVETDLASIHATGTTNTVGYIESGTYFYLNGTLVRAKKNILVNATFTDGTNYETVTAGGLNSIDNRFCRNIGNVSDATLDALTTPGIYYGWVMYSSSCPTKNQWTVLIVAAPDTGYCSQIAISAQTSLIIASRYMNNNAWTAWFTP